MITRTSKLRLCVTLLTANLVFIWGNSLLPGEVSGAVSDAVGAFLAGLFPAGGPAAGGTGLLRKAAHFLEFASLGLLLAWLLTMLGKRWVLALPLGALAACVDETIQIFVPDRGPAVKDVLIDTGGVLTGMILLRIGYLLWKRNKPNKMEERI